VDPFLEQLKQLCVAHVTRSKWVFVPTHTIGRTLGERIAREGVNWLNLRFVTPLDVALRMAGPFLVEQGVTPSEEGLGPALMMRLLLDLPQGGGYFRPLAQHPTMAQALWATVRELRMAGFGPEDLKLKTFSSPAKHAELVALLSAYQNFLSQHNRGDMAMVYEEALRHPDWCPIQPEDCWTELPDTIWTPLQRSLIDSMKGERLIPRSIAVSGVQIPRRMGSQRIKRLPADPATNPLAFLLAPALASRQPRLDRQIALFHAGGREAEIEEVFRRILDSGTSLDQVEIACASEAHLALIWEKALRHNWPVTLGSGVASVLTRPGRALIGFCDWIETDFSAGHFRRLLQSGDLKVKEEDQGFTLGQAARLLAQAEAGWGRATYNLALSRLHKSYESRAADRDASEDERAAAQSKAEQTLRVREWIVNLVDSVPAPGQDGKVPLQAVVASAVDFLRNTTARSSALDHRSATALEDYIGELNSLGPFSCGLSESLRFIRERIQSLQVASERPRPGHLFACGLAQAGYAGRAHTFVVGLEEGRVFPSSTEDAVLLDQERGSISPSLRLSADKIDEAVFAFVARLAASPSSVTFSHSCRDTREFRETYASWLMLQAFRLQNADEALVYRDLKKALGEPKSLVPENRDSALSSGAWWLRSVAGSGDAGIRLLDPAFPATTAGRHAEECRNSPEFTAFDGYVPEAGAKLDPTAPGTALSVTELERAAECPFRFFLKRGLGVRAVDERERDRDVWLDPLTRGSELHDLYASLLRRARDEGRHPNPGDAVWLKALAQSRLNQLNEEMPASTTEILERESKDFLADVELFVEAEAAKCDTQPIAFEVSFGRPLDADDQEPLARSAPVEIDLGSGVKFRIAGRIDRIDQVGPDTFEILDYKTGGYWSEKWKGTFNGGRRLQHALYGLAAIELLKTQYKNPKISRGIYYFSSYKGRRERVEIAAPARESIAAVLGDLRDVILQGHFIRTGDERDCRFCDYLAACGPGVNQQAKEKHPDSKLEIFRRLGTYE